MKKALLTLGIIALATSSSFAFMDASTTSSMDTLKRQGYSESMTRVVDVAKSHHQGEGERYARQYTPKEHGTVFKKAYHKVKLYFDPVQDDGKFGEHEIEFSNNWTGDYVQYANPLEPKNAVENL